MPPLAREILAPSYVADKIGANPDSDPALEKKKPNADPTVKINRIWFSTLEKQNGFGSGPNKTL